MSWLQTITFSTAPVPISSFGTSLGAVLNNLTHDVQFWGGNVDAGGNFLVNCAGVLPSGATAYLGLWSSAVTYAAGVVVIDSGGITYMSLQAANLNNTPSSSPTWWRPLVAAIISAFGQTPALFTATAGQTVFTATFALSPYCFVMVNGIKVPQTGGAYAISGNSATFAVGLLAGDIVEILQ